VGRAGGLRRKRRERTWRREEEEGEPTIETAPSERERGEGNGTETRAT